MIPLKLIVSLACLAVTSLAFPASSLFEAAAVRQCIGWTKEAETFADGVSPACICRVARARGDDFASAYYRQLVSNNVLASVLDNCKTLQSRSSMFSVADDGGSVKTEDAGGVLSTPDPPKISSCVYDTTGSYDLSPTPVDASSANLSGSCRRLFDRGLSDHLNPTFPDEDEGEE